MKKNSHLALAAELLRGAYDLHMHAAPSPFNRKLDDYQLLQEADRAGMAGILLKSHYESTAARAMLANEHGGCAAKAYGALALNRPVGGLNPYAVHNALKRNARIIFMPTRDASNSLVSGDMPGDFFRRPGVTVLDAEGRLKPEVYDIMDAVLQYDAALATGHLSPEESLLLCREGRKRGVRMILTHPEFSRTVIPAEVQKEMADIGVWIEKTWYNIGEKECTAEDMAAHIRAAGAQHCFMVTDRGQAAREAPAEAMALFIAAMLEQGFSAEEITRMTHDNPRAILAV